MLQAVSALRRSFAPARRPDFPAAALDRLARDRFAWLPRNGTMEQADRAARR